MNRSTASITHSVVIPNLNQADRLEKCLRAVAAQKNKQTEIIVVDNQSGDNSREVAQTFDLRIIVESEYQSPYACRHRGIQEAEGNVIVLLDSQAVPNEGWLEAGCRAVEKGRADIVSGRMIPEYQYIPPGRLERFDYLHAVIGKNPNVLPAGNLFFHKSLYMESAGFDPSKRSLEDMKWTERLSQKGYILEQCPEAAFSYPVKSGIAFRQKYMRHGGGRIEQGAGNGLLNIPYIFKNILPPHPNFYRNMMNRNRRTGTDLGSTAVYLICWYVKLLYASGAIKKIWNR